MQWILPLSPWQQARRTVRARRRCSVGQVLKSARTSTLPAGHRIGGVTCVMTGPAPSRASIAAGSHHRAPRGTLTRIPRFRPEPRVAATLRCVSTNRPPGEDAMCVPRRVAAGCNLGAWDQTSVRDALREKGTTEVQRGLYLLHVPCTVYRLGGARRGAPSVRERLPAGRLSAPARPPAPAGSGTPGTARWPACAPSCGT